MPLSGERLLIILLIIALLLEIAGVIVLTLSPPEVEPVIVDRSIAAVFLVALAIAVGAAIYLARSGAERPESSEATSGSAEASIHPRFPDKD